MSEEVDREVLIGIIAVSVAKMSMEDSIALLHELSARCTQWAAKLEYRQEIQGDVDRA